MRTDKNRLWSDLIWYLSGSFVPLLVGVLRTPVFTRYFTPAEYGYYGLILITYTILSVFLYSWLTNCIWRFYNFYKKEKSLNQFYFNLFFLYTCFSLIFFGISIVWSGISVNLLTKKLTLLIFLQLLVNYPINYILVVDRLELKTLKYNSIQMIRAILSFGVLYLLTFGLNFRIESVPLATLIIDLIILLIILPPFLKKINLRLKQLSLTIIKNLFNYSTVSIVSSLSLVILASSDRYLIAYFCNISEVGIYNQVYNLSQVTITALVTVFFAIINPHFMKSLENNFTGSNRLTKNYFFSYFIVLFPITVYLSMFSYQLSIILLGKDFRSGYDIIPYVMFSSFIYGLTLFPDNRLKFSLHYSQLITGIIICSAINIVLNVIFLPFLGYKFAAISTLICYSLLMIYYFFLDIKKNSFTLTGMRVLIPSIITLTAQLAIDYLIRHIMEINLELIGSLIEAGIFCGIYVIIIYLLSSHSLRLFIKNVNS